MSIAGNNFNQVLYVFNTLLMFESVLFIAVVRRVFFVITSFMRLASIC